MVIGLRTRLLTHFQAFVEITALAGGEQRVAGRLSRHNRHGMKAHSSKTNPEPGLRIMRLQVRLPWEDYRGFCVPGEGMEQSRTQVAKTVTFMANAAPSFFAREYSHVHSPFLYMWSVSASALQMTKYD